MRNETVYDILLDYLNQRKNAELDSESIKRRLKRNGKNEDEIHQIIVEFDDEWDRECIHLKEVKYSKTIFEAYFIFLCAILIQILLPQYAKVVKLVLIFILFTMLK